MMMMMMMMMMMIPSLHSHDLLRSLKNLFMVDYMEYTR